MERVETLTPETDFSQRVDPRGRARRRNLAWPIVAIVVIVAVIAAIVLLWRRTHAPEPPLATPSPPPQAAAPAAAPTPEATTPKYPIQAAQATQPPPEQALPAVADSDSMMQDALASLFTGVALDHVFHLQQIVPRFVATIDNLPRQTVALSRMSVKPVEGSLKTAQADGKVLLRADNAERYATYMHVLEQVDTPKLVQTYVHYYPLFQQAYQDLGYPHGYFNDRLVEVIDHLLATPDVPAPVALSQPKVLYEYADPALEQLSAGQKILIRMGPVDESRVKAKLREIRRALTGQKLPR